MRACMWREGVVWVCDVYACPAVRLPDGLLYTCGCLMTRMALGSYGYSGLGL